MNRDGFLLGFLATATQVLLLRELVAAFGGSELFVGTALFGWLLWVAAGAWLGGGRSAGRFIRWLFLGGVTALLICLLATRLAPLVITDIVGEMVPVSTAVLISMLVTGPVGLLTGWLFPAIARQSGDAGSSIVRVYLYEGLGAFAAGIVVVLLVGHQLSNIGVGLVIGIIVMAGGLFRSDSRRRLSVAATAGLLLIMLVTRGGVSVDQYLNSRKYHGYSVERSFDTHYGHQTILSRDQSLVLLTDNTVEAIHPDLESVENLLIPPLLYWPQAESVLLLGRAEFGVAQLAAEFPGISLSAVDPRKALSGKLVDLVEGASSATVIDDDPAAFLLRTSPSVQFDIIALNPGVFDSYRNGRFVTRGFLEEVKRHLKPGGIFCLPTGYDTDRYVTDDTRELLSIIVKTLSDSFGSVAMWPGTRTLLLASDRASLDLPYDTLMTRLSDLSYQPEYVSDNYLIDRLNEFKIERLRDRVGGGTLTNSVVEPLLPSYQLWFRAKADRTDRELMKWVLRRPLWLFGLPPLILAFLAWTLRRRHRRDRFGLFLYFTAGVVSLSLELLSFYVYQSTVGSLYSEMAVLIGTFMLGLALGTYVASKTARPGLGRLSLATLLAATILFGLTWSSVDCRLVLVYHLLFLLVVALATGSLFVAATRRYYADRENPNRGAGYACELAGSALGALLTTTVLLPVIGLHWLLVSLMILLAVGLVLSLLKSA